ncbi:DEAD/DEAH box helicase family protein [Candidatus Parcubacteria bacterium]|nr:DEAD/DEAH box helicase family protein [Patescibacteria group bacterium]MCG2688064.1 DEAD/DEAH box helicase family protein [Candidatus Parcubacteria bacterium]
MQLKTYQEDAIDDLLDKAKKLLNMAEGKKLVFKAPTGSGKTIMMAEFLKQLVDDKEIKQSLSFIWAAPKKLHIQSKEKLDNYYEKSRTLECSYFEDLSDRKIDENEILFFNWSSVNKKGTNTIVKENEQEFYLSKVLERTREEGRKIILIIDEVHYSAGQMDKKERSAALQLRKDIEPSLTIEVSATPILAGDYEVSVQTEEVKKEAMIKKSLVLNPNFVNVFKDGKIKTELGEKKLEKDSEETVIRESLNKRKELIKSYQKEGSDVNPLVLIQLPDRKGQREDELKDKVIKILKDKFNISTEKGNNKLAIWLSGEHVNKEDVERNDSEVEVLLFKQAIALGWDCPRAQVMALFREWHSPIFSIQTVGRIMRMPEPDRGKYYTEEILNYAYIYTNINDIVIDKDVAPGYVSFLTSRRRIDYKNVNLLSCYSKRHREKTRLSTLFIEMFLAQTKKYGLKNKIDTKARKVDVKIISDYKAKDIDTLVGSKIVGDKAITISSFDLQKLFDYFVRNNLQPFYPEDRSVNRVKESIYKFFEKELKMNYSEKWEEIVRIILDGKNLQYFINILDKTKIEYQNEIVKKESELILLESWNVPEILSFGSDYIKENKKRAAMVPFYVKYLSGLEKSFTEFLDKSGKVEWWFKNGDRDATFFAVPYENGEKKPFYVDFIVKMRDGRVGLFDPHGTYLSDFGPKSDGLRRYIQSENKKGKNLFGGLVANTGNTTNNGRWVYFTDSGAKFKKGEFADWTDLEL